MTTQSDHRLGELREWLKHHVDYSQIVAIPGDASFRRYFRVHEGAKTFIGVDAPPIHENNHAFVYLSKGFLANGLTVPEVFAHDFDKGFLLLSDLGDIQLLNVLRDDNVDRHYSSAMEDLGRLQYCRDFSGWQLPLFGPDFLLNELIRFHEWFLVRHLGIKLTAKEMHMLQTTYSLLIEIAVSQPQVCVHRDYHSRNLMLLPGDFLGILDFQDAVIGPISYDLVSLLRDCYIKWPVAKIYQWVEQFWRLQLSSRALHSLPTFIQWFDWMGLQRHLKVLGIFARLYHRDHKENYLKDIPRILEYVVFVLDNYSEFKTFREFLLKRVIDESNDSSSRAREANASSHRCYPEASPEGR